MRDKVLPCLRIIPLLPAFMLSHHCVRCLVWVKLNIPMSLDVSCATSSNGPPKARLGATKMPIVKNVRSIFVSKFVPQKFSQLTVSVGMSIEGPAVAFYPGAFWNVFDRWCYESENTTRGHLSFHNAHFEFISTFYHGKCSVWPLDPLGYFSTCCVPSVTFLGNFEHERFHEEIKMYKLGPELWA